MSEITKAVQARQTQILQLQRDIEALRRAARVLGGKAKGQSKTKRRKRAAVAKPAQPKGAAKSKSKAKPKAQGKRRHQWTAAEKAAIGRRMKAYWAKRRKAKG